MPIDKELLKYSISIKRDDNQYNIFTTSAFMEAVLILYRQELFNTYLSDPKKLKNVIDIFKKENFYSSGIIPPKTKDEDLKSSYGNEEKSMECTLAFKSRTKFKGLERYLVRLRQLKPKTASNMEKLRSLKNLDITVSTPAQFYKDTICVMPYEYLKKWDDITREEYDLLFKYSRKPYTNYISPYGIAGLMWIGKETEFTDYFGLFSPENIFLTVFKLLNGMCSFAKSGGKKKWLRKEIDEYYSPALKELKLPIITKKIEELHHIDRMPNKRKRNRELRKLEYELDRIVPSEQWLRRKI